jgi:aminoglycoside 3-N-acetyltransferase
VFVHSSVDRLNLGFPFYGVLSILREIVGPEGTLLFPTYPRLSSYEFLKSGEVFDVRKSASYTGILTEVARRQKGAVRSFFPTKSVCAIGAQAARLTATHQDSPYPYDSSSPYFKIMEFKGKIIGFGVGTWNLSFVHCVDDFLKEAFPVMPYHKHLFRARCINYAGEEAIVPTYAHDMRKMNHDVPRFMKNHIPSTVCGDIVVDGMNFFRADSAPLFEAMIDFARKGITIYPAESYREHDT